MESVLTFCLYLVGGFVALWLLLLILSTEWGRALAIASPLWGGLWWALGWQGLALFVGCLFMISVAGVLQNQWDEMREARKAATREAPIAPAPPAAGAPALTGPPAVLRLPPGQR